MRNASRDYKHYKALQETENTIPDTVIIANSEYDEEVNNKQEGETTDVERKINSDDVIVESREDSESTQSVESTSQETDKSEDASEEEEGEEDSESDAPQDKDRQLLDYLFLAKLFA